MKSADKRQRHVDERGNHFYLAPVKFDSRSAMHFLVGIGMIAAPAISAAAAQELCISDLRCEYLQNPMGIDAPAPRLSWTLTSTKQGDAQTAYQIQVASTDQLLRENRADLWESGRQFSDQTIQISYRGKALPSGQRCVWRVRAWDCDAAATPWSAAATWTMGLLRPSDWTARWISGGAVEGGPMPIFRRSIRLDSRPIARAMLFISGLGQFELHVNGKKAGEALMQPGWTNYRKTILYEAQDITPLLRPGENVLGVMLGNGMYNIPRQRYAKFTGSFGAPMLIAQLQIEYGDGGRQTIVSDSSWKVRDGPITFSSIYGGEDFDARAEPAGWDEPNYDDSSWRDAREIAGAGGTLSGSTRSAPAIRVQQILHSRAMTRPAPGVLVFDLGQNCAILPQIKVKGPAGATVRLTPGETLNDDGTVSQVSCGGPAYFQYTLKGDDEETWAARFTYYGCRYIQVDGAQPSGGDSSLPTVLDVSGKFISSADDGGEFACSNELLNRTAGIIRWAMRSNSMSILTDCPHREKLGWLEQDHLAGPSLIYSFSMAPMLMKICSDIRESQTDSGLVPDIAPEYPVFAEGFRDSPEWGSAAVLLPWQLYRWYGDVEILRQQYPTITRYLEHLHSQARDGILSYGLGDWYDLGPRGDGHAQLTPPALTATAFYYHDLCIAQQIAALLGKNDEAAKFASLSQSVRDAFNHAFYHSDLHGYSTLSQTANAIPLAMGLAPAADRAAILQNIVDDVRRHNNGLTSGDIGYRYLLRALADGGRSDVIFDMNSRSDRPGYGMILASGATALTEAWTGRRADGQGSQDHFMLGHIMEWFYCDLAGIGQDAQSIAFKKIVIKPTPVGDLRWAWASFASPRGTILSSWKIDGGKFLLDVQIPPGTTASVFLPGAVGKAIEVQSGKHHFESATGGER